MSRSGPQTQPLILYKPFQYPTPNNLRFIQPATAIRPTLSSNNNLPIVRPPLVQRFVRPTIIRPLPPRLVTHENSLNRVDPTTIEAKLPARIFSSESSLSTLSTIPSNHEEIRQQQRISSSKMNDCLSSNCILNTRAIYIIIILLFIFFLIVILLLIVLIIVHH
ncbi:unnamed protein product [Rotaria socialis]|uniref:Uncharacterized protein n=1 Tax=Rotaria socialis TaxID=392032 RepID=A0A821A9P6_9BILA|nr:unnamed protein product [Rotaria socialis]CAF3631465.1 unnamed protein product [Rotaria socialis]CAF3652868.1 unnamed protein product [Rotaria socialis]CAF4474585.1 unnamed protein product [Rotaria socialis]CAF4577258.1 unnamed protein product [Rotaria socialis]